MEFQISTFSGDNIYCICCTGDAVMGDDVCFERATFSGYFRNAKFAGFERITGTIIKDSYGPDKQQHTFTLLLDSGYMLRIKGRNLYANGTYRRPWDDEAKRSGVAAEKHQRGDVARAVRQRRKTERDYA